jgi:hypothetical protein
LHPEQAAAVIFPEGIPVANVSVITQKKALHVYMHKDTATVHPIARSPEYYDIFRKRKA